VQLVHRSERPHPGDSGENGYRDADVGGCSLDLGVEVPPVHHRHHQIKNDEIGGAVVNKAQGHPSIGRVAHRATLFLKKLPEQHAEVVIVVNDEYVAGALHSSVNDALAVPRDS